MSIFFEWKPSKFAFNCPSISIFIILQRKQGIGFASSSKLCLWYLQSETLTLGTVPEPLAASSPCLPVPAWPRQLKNAKKGPVAAEGKEKTYFLLSRDTLQVRRAAKIPRSSSLHTWMVGRIPELWIKYKPVRKCLLTIRPWALSHASNMSWFCFLNASVKLYYYYHYCINF